MVEPTRRCFLPTESSPTTGRSLVTLGAIHYARPVARGATAAAGRVSRAARTLRLAVAAAVVAVLVAPVSGPAAPPTWQAPSTLSSVARAPSIHVDSAGTVTAFMRSGNFPSWRDLAWEHAPGGQWPSTPTPLSPAGIGDAVLAVSPAGAAVVVWTNSPLLQASYRPAGGAWGPTEMVANTGGPYSHLRIALDDAGNVAVTWYRNTSTSTALVEVALRSVSSGWLPVDTMPPGPREIETQPDVAFERTGDVVLVWGSDTAIPSYTRLLASTRSLASTWSAPVELSPPTTSAQDVSLNSNRSGTVVATWHDVNSVRAAVRTGGAWGPANVLASPGGIGSLADIGRAAVDAAGNVTTLWSRYDSATWRVEASSRPAGGAWQLPATTLSADANGSTQPVLAGSDSGHAAATWRQSDGTNVRIAAAIRPAGGSWPGSPLFVSTAGVDAESGSVVIDSTGLAAAVWIEGGFHGVARAAFSDGIAPTATIATPPDGATYQQGAVVAADYSCADDLPGQLASCSGAVPDDAPIATATVGPASFAVTATDRAGNATMVTHSYTVAAAPPLAISSVAEVSNTVGRFERFEAGFELSRSYADPFDPAAIAVDVTFTAPSGAQTTVPAFWFQGYRVKPGTEAFEDYEAIGDPGWRVRFAPTELGTFTYSIAATDGTGASAAPMSGAFDVLAGLSRGFVRRDSGDPLALRFDNGDPYVPVGHNVAFEEPNPPGLSGTGYYERLFSSFERADENWSRVWMTDFNRSALEWSAGHWSDLYDGVGRYSLASGWRMDEILESAEQHGVYIQLVLNDHGQFSTFTNPRWHENPYNAANGGPVPEAAPHLFFSDPTARELHERRLRYVAARWGAFTNVLAWELFNEVQFIGTSSTNMYGDPSVRAAVVDWHQEMGDALDRLDAHQHLVSTSSQPSPVDDGVSAVSSIDLLQVHLYSGPEPELDRTLVGFIRGLQADHGKPVLGGEIGLPSNSELGFDPTTFAGSQADREHLSQGTHLHNAAWAAAHARSVAASWWWGSYIAEDASKNRAAPSFPLNEATFPPLAAYLAGEDWAADGLVDAAITASPSVYAVGVASTSAARLWARDVLNGYGSGERPGDLAGRVVSNADVTVSGMDDGSYEIEVWDPWGGSVVSSFIAFASGGDLTIDLPPFTRDVAIKAAFAGPAPPQDSDGDGLADTWEENGIDGDGDGDVDLALDQPPYNADPQHKDVFVEVDYMAAHAPQPATLADVTTAFDNASVDNPDGSTGVRLHALLGESVTTIAPVRFLDRGPGAADDFDDLKLGGAAACDGFFGTPGERTGTNCAAVLAAKKLAFHYAVFGHSYAEGPTSSGIAELPGNDFMVTLGGKSPEWIAAAGSLSAAEAGTFLHELGHNFGLRHGGFENRNCKPNYQSVMSYTLQVPYIDRPGRLDYSREQLPSLDESDLDEEFGLAGASGNVVFGGSDHGAVVAPAAGAIDWNDDGSIDVGVAADVNWIERRPDGAPLPGCGESPADFLEGHDDWSNLAFDFQNSADFADGLHESSRALVAQELTSEIALETAQNVDADGDSVPNAADHPIAFASSRTGSGDIFTVDPSGGVPARLTSSTAIDAEPEWSPDRTKVVFTSTRHGNLEIYVMAANGASVTRLTTNSGSDTSPAWSPDGSKIAFASNRGGSNWDIYSMKADGTSVARLTTHSAADTFPAWSPNGAKIAFSSARTTGGDIYVMNANGTAQTRLTSTSGVDTEPAWSGSAIAFSTNRDGNFELYRMSENGSGQVRLTVQPGHDGAPAWSPGGTMLAFATNRLGSNFEIYSMNADGSRQTRVTTDPGIDIFPDW